MRSLTKVYEPNPAWMRLLTRSASKREVTALRAVDLDVHAGSICAVVGPNGAGKSTMFRILMGLTVPTSGSAHIHGLDCSVRSESRHMPVGFMPADDRSLFLRLTCYENLAFQAQLRGYTGARLRSRVEECLEMVGLEQARDRAAFALSSGMKARLQLSRAMVHEPSVLILDEPTSTIDPVAADDLLGLVQELVTERSLAVMLSSHRLEEIDALDETVVLLDAGRVAFHGDLGALRAVAAVSEVTLEFQRPELAAAAAERLTKSIVARRADHDDRVVEVESKEHVGAVLHVLGELTSGIVRLDERSSSTRALLREVYSSRRAEEVTS